MALSSSPSSIKEADALCVPLFGVAPFLCGGGGEDETAKEQRGWAIPPLVAPVPTLADAAIFESNWDVFTMGQLRGLDWSNVVCAGGAVLACSTTIPPPPTDPDAAKAATAQLLCRAGKVDEALSGHPAFLAFHGRDAPGGLATADIDLWLYGMTPAQAAQKVEHIAAVLRANAAQRGGSIIVVRTKNTFSFVSAFPFRIVQVVRTVFASPAQVLLDFDLDSCALGYDGSRVLAAPRALSALSSGANVMRSDLTRLSLKRMLKYARRGFPTKLPTAIRGGITPRTVADLFSAAKIGLLIMTGAPVTLRSLITWRSDGPGDIYPRFEEAPTPPETWIAGFTAEGRAGPRGAIYVAGPLEEADSRDEEPDAKAAKGDAGGAEAAKKRAAEEAQVCAAAMRQCELVASLYGKPPSASGGRSYEDAPLDFPELLQRPTDYGEAEPDIPYGPPLASDDGKSPLTPLDLEEAEPTFGGRRADEERRSPVSTEEAAAMIGARANTHGRAVVAVASAPAELTSMLARPGELAPASGFADALPASEAGAMGYVRVKMVTVAFPTVTFPSTKEALEKESPPLGAVLSALGRDWHVGINCHGSNQLVFSITLLPLSEAEEEADSEEVQAPAPSFLRVGEQALIPVNVLLNFSNDAVFLDSHALLSDEEGGARMWSHFLYWDSVPLQGRLGIVLQVACVEEEEAE